MTFVTQHDKSLGYPRCPCQSCVDFRAAIAAGNKPRIIEVPPNSTKEAMTKAIDDMLATGTGAVRVDPHAYTDLSAAAGMVEAALDAEVVDRFVGGIGDVTSSERGSGARYNAGKTPMELLPLRMVAKLLQPQTESQKHLTTAVMMLGAFQDRSSRSDCVSLRCAFEDVAIAAGLTAIELVEETAQVLGYGAKKYAHWNWATGMPWSVPLACAARHIRAMWGQPTAIDADSGRLHAGHVGANLLMLMQFLHSYKEGDDRPTELQYDDGV